MAPAVQAIGSITPGRADSVFVGVLQGGAQEPTFHFEFIGRALLAQLGAGCMANPIAPAGDAGLWIFTQRL